MFFHLIYFLRRSEHKVLDLVILMATWQAKITSEHQKIATYHDRIIPDPAKMTPDHARIIADHAKMAPDRAKTIADRTLITNDRTKSIHDLSIVVDWKLRLIIPSAASFLNQFFNKIFINYEKSID